MTARLALVALLILGGCGTQQNLQRTAGEPMPPLPVGVAVQREPEEQLRLPPQAAPDRVNDPLGRSTEQPDDRFNLPPPG